MYCVIQEVKKKKIPPGESKEIEVYTSSWTIGGEQSISYEYKMSDDEYERTIDIAYRISIHQSYREGGKVKKKQFYICTIGYYDVVDCGEWIGNYVASGRWKKILESLGLSDDALTDMIYKKWEPISKRIEEEFAGSPEGQAKAEHDRIKREYEHQIELFMKKYETTRTEYKKCYDIFGELRNPAYLEKIKREYQSWKEYEERSRSYQEDFSHNHRRGSGSRSYSDYEASNYSEDEKEMLKQFYRVLSKKYHPDANPDSDTSKQMQLLNQLKSSWGI